MANTLDQEMFSYFNQLNETEKKSVMLLLKTFLIGRQNNPDRISVEQYNKEIEEAEAEIEQGNFSTHTDVIEISKHWINGR